MSKRFPIPEFDRHQYKNMAWDAPHALDARQAAGLLERRRQGDASVFGGHVVAAEDALFERHGFRGAHRHAVMCLMPDRDVRLVGRSYAWTLQRALVLDSLDPAAGRVLHDWRTPRTMNTRLGPENGVTLSGGGVVYVVCGWKNAEHWVFNRVICDNGGGAGARPGLRLLSAWDERINDFHSCNLSFDWVQ